MLSYLANATTAIFGPLRVLRYITVRTLLAAGTAALIGFIIGPWLIGRLRRLKFGQNYDDDRTGDLAQRFDKKNTPTMGGLLIFGSRVHQHPSLGGAKRQGCRRPFCLHRADRGRVSRRLPQGGSPEPRWDFLR